MKSKKKILIIDDEEELCEMLALRLSCLGFEAEYAFSGEKGLKKIPQFSPDVILLDVVMPLMSGWEVCQLIKANPQYKNIKVILLTATQSNGHLSERSKEILADAAFIKPFDEDQLIETINSFF